MVKLGELAVAAPSIAVDPTLLFVANNVLAIAVSAAPILSPQLIAKPSQMLTRFIPLLGRLISLVLQRLAAFCEVARVRREQIFIMTHGALTYACGDMIAQAAFAPAAASDAPSAAAGALITWLPAQTLRAAVVGLLSDTLPFYHWSSFLASMDQGERRAALLRRMPLLARMPALILPFKIGIHLATFQPLSTAGYLFLQGLVREGGIGAAAAFVRSKFAAAILPALCTFAVGGPLIYSLPVLLGAALRNLGVLAMCVYLAYVSGAN